MKNIRIIVFIGLMLLIEPLFGQPLTKDSTSKRTQVDPAVFDLREEARTGKVRTQPAGACWASAAISTLESVRITAGFSDPPLSDRHMQLFHGFHPSRSVNGNFAMATAYFTRGTGPVSQNPATDTILAGVHTKPFLITEANYLPRDTGLIKHTIRTQGSVYTMMHFRKEQHDTISNIYYAQREGINHVVTLVGWNDTVKTRVGRGVWIAQNSLGYKFGDSGFFYVPYQDQSIAIYNAIWTKWIDFDERIRVLYYDTTGSYYSFDLSDSVCYGMVKFTVTEKGRLEQVATSVNLPSSIIQAWVYNEFDPDEKMVSGLLASTCQMRFTYPGYYTIPLPRKILFEPGENFFIVMKYIVAGSQNPLPVEMQITDYSEPVLNNGQGWINSGSQMIPENWRETGQNAGSEELKFNLCIRGLFYTD